MHSQNKTLQVQSTTPNAEKSKLRKNSQTRSNQNKFEPSSDSNKPNKHLSSKQLNI
jgi:hypothetical protein